MLLRTLQKIHNLGVIHRDIKPENILSVNGKWKFSDFGLSKLKSTKTMTGTMKGSPIYMAPEQIDHVRFGQTDVTTDLWQMGILLYRLVMGRNPYGESGDNLIAFVNAVCYQGGPDLSEVPPEWLPVFRRAFKTEHSERYQSADEFADAVESVGTYGPEEDIPDECDEDTIPNDALENLNEDPTEESIESYQHADGFGNGGSVVGQCVPAGNVIIPEQVKDGTTEVDIEDRPAEENTVECTDENDSPVAAVETPADPISPEQPDTVFAGNDPNADAEQLYRLGMQYESGNGVGQSNPEAVRHYRAAAEQGHADAMYSLGMMYRDGRGVRLSDDEAIRWFRMAAEQGHADAQYNLGRMLSHIISTASYTEEIRELFTKAAEQGNVDAQYYLGRMYLDERQNITESFKWFSKAAEQGHADAQCYLGMLYRDGKGVQKSDEDALRWLRESAKQRNSDSIKILKGMRNGSIDDSDPSGNTVVGGGSEDDPEEMYRLGMQYDTGDGVEQSGPWAARYFRFAAESGHPEAQYRLGTMYRCGRGVPENKKAAKRWFEEAAEQGIVDAQFCLGRMYRYSMGLSHSDRKAFEWFSKAADKGNVDAQFCLGQMYHLNDENGSRSSKEAFEWFSKAAEQGHADAQYHLGQMYEVGDVVDRSGEEAVGWYTKAAEQGLPEAQYRLGLMYRDGQIVQRSDEMATSWFRKPARLGYPNSQKALCKMYRDGLGTPLPEEQETDWYKKNMNGGFRGLFNR